MAEEFPTPSGPGQPQDFNQGFNVPPPGQGPVQEFPTPAPVPPKRSNTIWIVLAIVVVLLCCCCLAAVAIYLYQNGDRLFNIPTSIIPLVTSFI